MRAGRRPRLGRAILVLSMGILLGLLTSYLFFENIRKNRINHLHTTAERFESRARERISYWRTSTKSYGALSLRGVLNQEALLNSVARSHMVEQLPGFYSFGLIFDGETSTSPTILISHISDEGAHEEMLKVPEARAAIRRSNRNEKFVVSQPFPSRRSWCVGPSLLLVQPIEDGRKSRNASIYSAVCLPDFFSSILKDLHPEFAFLAQVESGDVLISEVGLGTSPEERLLAGVRREFVLDGFTVEIHLRSLPFPFSWEVGLPVLLFVCFIGVGLLLYTVIASDARERFLAEEMIEGFRLSQKRAGFLAEVSRLLASRPDTRQVLDQLARKAVPLLGSGCGIVLLEGESDLRVVLTTVDSNVERSLKKAFSTTPFPLPGFGALLLEMDRKKLKRIPGSLFEKRVVAAAPPERQVELRRALRWCAIVPMVARGKAIGALVVRMWRGKRYGPRDFALIHDFATRIALALDNEDLLDRKVRAIRVRDEFLSIASHELLSPLTALKAHIQGLARLRRLGGAIPEDRFEHAFRVADRQIQRLSNLIHELLDVARIESKKLVLQPEPVVIAEVVDELCQRYRAEAIRAGSQLEFVGSTSFQGHYDRFRLEQVFTNLLSNAIKYGNHAPIHVTVTEMEGGEEVRVSFRDHGLGIAPDALKRIFIRFERAIEDSGYGGLGLGLFIAKEIVEAHGGRIEVESAPSEGSTFTVILPRRTPDAPP